MRAVQLSRVNTLYIYERLWVALDCETTDEVCRKISDLMAELAVNYHADTGQRIGTAAALTSAGSPNAASTPSNPFAGGFGFRHPTQGETI
ncbi:MAG: hypothetical protein VW496_01265 [Pelagibacteraceae bacterium]